MELRTNVEMTGPFFQGAAGQKLKSAMSGAVRELTNEAETFLNDRLKPQAGGGVYKNLSPADGGSTGHYRRSISTELKQLNALITDGGVIYGPWLEGISSRNTSTRFKGYSSFRRAAQFASEKSERVFKAYVARFVRSVS
jgi:hypothetical protein